MAQRLGPFALEGTYVRLEPLRRSHAVPLYEAARRMNWGWMLGPLRTRGDVDARIAKGLRGERLDEEYAFAVVLRDGPKVIGSTAYLGVATKHRRAEIGSTWYVPEHWGTVVNPECKYLLLKHAFEDWGAARVQLATDARNLHSQGAILKLGAKYEGRLRNYGVLPDGTLRDTMLYSIVEGEWPAVKRSLIARIRSFGT
ncbi:MAG: GNAT family N-acetyltransferase [Thaumarchaeota archaeon]|nr:GNAT family N-acetyltransferase [Nitrososphaerota archaeon]